MNWKQLFCRHDYIPIERGFIGHGTYWGNDPSDIEPTHRYLTTYECYKCGKSTKHKSEIITYLDKLQPYDNDTTKQLLKRS